MLAQMPHPDEPRAWYRPRGEATLQVITPDGSRQLALDDLEVDLPPQWNPRLAKPAVRARIQRVPGGHRLLPMPGREVTVNGRAVDGAHGLRGGDELRVDGFFAVYTAARQELPTPMRLQVWPPEGPPVEIRTHRARISIGTTEADLVVEDPTVDGVHCSLSRARNGTLEIEDHGSYNGTWVDGIRVVHAMGLRPGAAIQIGNTTVRAFADSEAAERLERMAPQDRFDGLPDGGLDPRAREPAVVDGQRRPLQPTFAAPGGFVRPSAGRFRRRHPDAPRPPAGSGASAPPRGSARRPERGSAGDVHPADGAAARGGLHRRARVPARRGREPARAAPDPAPGGSLCRRRRARAEERHDVGDRREGPPAGAPTSAGRGPLTGFPGRHPGGRSDWTASAFGALFPDARIGGRW